MVLFIEIRKYSDLLCIYSLKLILSGYSSYVIVDFDPIGFYSRIGGRSLVRACRHNGFKYILQEHFYS